MKHWWEEDYSEELTIIAIMVIIIVVVQVIGKDASNTISAGIGGLIGYLKRSSK